MPSAEDSNPSEPNDLVGWVEQEVRDLLDAGPVGLYEFIWLLHGVRITATQEQLRSYAFAALTRLEKDEAIRRVRLVWLQEDGVAAPQEELLLADWDEPENDKPYLAVTLKSHFGVAR
jgi:hypothetical protein